MHGRLTICLRMLSRAVAVWALGHGEYKFVDIMQ